jgi:glutamate-1-semialdehyde 2,1-aminomutase
MSIPNNHKQTFRAIYSPSKPVDKLIIKKKLQEQIDLYQVVNAKSGAENKKALENIPLGVHSTFQSFEPWPISMSSAKGAWVTNLDGRQMLDLSMGFGAMLVGHLNPEVVKELNEILEVGTLFTSPSPISRDAGHILCKRFGIDQIRFTNSGTESTLYAIRVAAAFTNKNGIAKIEGGYHGSGGPLMVSTKPPLDKIGSADDPIPFVPPTAVAGEVHVVPFNNADALERLFKKHASTISCLIMEPVMENIGIVVPDEGYLERVRELCDEYGVLLIFDEVKTGLTAGPQGAAQRLGVLPDLICLAKSIGGGVPLAAFGGKNQYMAAVSDGRMSHLGTFNGHLLGAAAVKAIDRIATPQKLAECENLNIQALKRIGEIISEYELPAHSVGFGVKGCTTWSETPVRNYRDYKATDFDLAELSFLWSINHDIMTPPGLDEQWLISFAHGQKEIDFQVEDFRNFAKYLRN